MRVPSAKKRLSASGNLARWQFGRKKKTANSVENQPVKSSGEDGNLYSDYSHCIIVC